MRNGYFLYDGKKHEKLPVMAFLAQSDKRKILINTGLQDTFENFTIYRQLARMGIHSDEITDIVLSSLHKDHVCCLKAFRNAEIYLQRKEYEFVQNSYWPPDGPEYTLPGIACRLKNRKIHLTDGEEEIMEGIFVYPSPGPSAGHQTVVVNTTEGEYHCCGDLIYTYENLNRCSTAGRGLMPAAGFLNIAEEQDSIMELRWRVRGRRFILPTHAPEMMKLAGEGMVLGA